MKFDNDTNVVYGVWSIDDLIKSKVQISSRLVAPVGNYNNIFNDRSKEFTLENIRFRVTADGKIIPLIKLKELNEYLTSDNLFVKSIARKSLDYIPAYCGKFLCGNTLCGYEVDSEETEPDITPNEGGITITDDSGSIVKDRIINIINSDIEDVETDEDNVTDININIIGKLLD